tara:strand:+ start:2742 stop:3266 length:525 start_codon:yes stop_codon:yes gene_type:complete
MSIDNFMLSNAVCCMDMFLGDEYDSLFQNMTSVVNYGNGKKVDIRKTLSEFDVSRLKLLEMVYNKNENLQSLFKTLQTAIGVSEECLDDNKYLNIQTSTGKHLVCITNRDQLPTIKAYFYLYHFAAYCRLHFVQLTKLGNINRPEFNETIWAQITLSNWKSFCEHVNHSLNFFN